MIAALVDSAKQGLTIKPSVKQRGNDLFGKLSVPYWMNKRNNKTQSKKSGDNFGVTDIRICCTEQQRIFNRKNNKRPG